MLDKSTRLKKDDHTTKVRISPKKKKQKNAKRRLDFDHLSKLESRMVLRDGDIGLEIKKTTIGWGPNVREKPTTAKEWLEDIVDLFCDEEL